MRVTALMVCRPGNPVAQGFVNRDRLFLEALRPMHEVSVVAIAADRRDLVDRIDVAVIEPDLCGRPDGRLARLARLALLRTGRLSSAERRLRGTIAATEPEVIVVLALWNAELVRCVAGLAPLAFFAEERLGRSRGHRRAGRVSLSQSLRRAELAAAGAASVIVVLREQDVSWASERFSRPVMVIPHGIDVAYWAADGPVDASAGPADVAVVANLMMERTAEPLAAIIDALEERGWPPDLRFRLVSATGHHRILLDRAGPKVELIGPLLDPRPLYRSAVATVVPAFEANGVKNGIIQGWAIGCPVITTPASAATVSGRDGVDVLIGSDPAELAALVDGLGHRDDLASIVAAGHEHLDERFGATEHSARALELIARLAAG